MHRPIFTIAMMAAALVPTAVTGRSQASELDKAVSALQAGGFTGVVVAGDRSGVTFERAVGLRDGERPHRVDQQWPWASVTKQVTAILVMRQVEAGRLNLDATVQSVLPEFQGPTGNRVTIRQLLQHTSGLPNPVDTKQTADGVPSFYRENGPGISDKARTRGYCSGAPKAEPGAAFSYNNCDYHLLGAVLERVTGRSYAELVRREISARVGATSLGLAGDDARHGGSAVVGYDDRAGSPHMNFAALGAGGALLGTPRDLLALNRALMTGGLLSEPATAEMWKGDPKLGYAALGTWSFTAQLRGCSEPVRLIERRGSFAGIQVRNLIAPGLGKTMAAFTNNGSLEFGEIWQGRGYTYELASAAFCGPTRS